ncbi:MAG: hydrogenase expression/formation protein HypE [Candidatus Syntrophoarchaeum butanivorans]|uniref:Hydrogenase expression/formation protein HypE n=2 Tax=Candidatus Syntropharchaeum butanivorans TaxID=1839936 RepID=A0A1F2P5D1_9EURY|nr:MAG: hydrogenase expression/formation protein HypE [Candidatus Syntrophoarchaeum butanivorans]
MMKIRMEDGAGGEGMAKFLESYVLRLLSKRRAGEIGLDELDDGASVRDFIFTVDGHTVRPLIFPGGDIGRLSVSGTVNDLAVMGAKPLALSSSMIIEAGFEGELLERILRSMDDTMREAGVPIVCGDTKVVEEKIGLFVTTSGIGEGNGALMRNIEVIREYRDYPHRFIVDRGLGEGDLIIVSGTVADHGMAILSLRKGIEFESGIESDVAPLWGMIEQAMACGGITAMKDPTRGGLSNALNELARKSGVGIEIDEERIPVKREVLAASEMLGLNFLDMASEGRVVMGVVREYAEEVLRALRRSRYGKDAEIIGEVRGESGEVIMRTRVGGRRVIRPPIGDPVPRVC